MMASAANAPPASDVGGFAQKVQQARRNAIAKAKAKYLKDSVVKTEPTSDPEVRVKEERPSKSQPQSQFEDPQTEGATSAHTYAALKSFKRKRSEDEATDAVPSPLRSPQSPAVEKRPFAPAKKPSRTPKTNYDSVTVIASRTTRHDPAWYQTINSKEKPVRSDVITMQRLMLQMRDCEAKAAKGEDLEEMFATIRQWLHQMEFWNFLTLALIKKSKLLDDKGLPTIFEMSAGVDYPWDIQVDSLALYQKWLAGRIDPHLLIGITSSQKKNNNGKSVKSRSLDPNYQHRVSCNYVGEGNLQNGQWWPLQICAMRDGAHGEIEAGIHGQKSKGAYSIVLATGGYSDVDDGETIKYCGTSGSDGKVTPATQHLLDACKMVNPVRVLRSSSLPASNQYRPKRGLRYDGLYQILDYDILDAATAMHQFWLKRVDGQHPIRCQGVEERPTSEELAEYSKIRSLLGLTG